MNTPPAIPVTPPATPALFSTPVKIKPEKNLAKKITSCQELLDCLFADNNIEKKDQINRYSNYAYMRNPLTAQKRRMFLGRDRSIGRSYPFQRYNIETLAALFTAYEQNELNFLPPMQKQPAQPNIALAHHTPTIETTITPSTPLARSPQRFFNQGSLSSGLPPLLPLFTTEDEESIQDINPIVPNSDLKTAPNDQLPPFHIPTNDDDDNIFDIHPLITVDCRFAVVSNGNGLQNMYFSLHDGADGMSHAQVALGKESEGACISAGVLTFIKQDSRWVIQSLTNKTGHFEMDVEGLLNPIGIILNHMNDYLTETITIAPHASTIGNADSFSLNISELRAKYEQSIPLLKQDLYSSETAKEVASSSLSALSDDELELFSPNAPAAKSSIRKALLFEAYPTMTLFTKKGKNNQGKVIKSNAQEEAPSSHVTP